MEYRLDNRLVEYGAYLWRGVVRLKYLPDPSPCPASLLDLVPNCPNILIVLRQDSSEVVEQINFLQHFAVDVE